MNQNLRVEIIFLFIQDESLLTLNLYKFRNMNFKISEINMKIFLNMS